MDQRWAGWALIFLGVMAGIFWLSGRWPHQFAPIVALLLLLTGTSVFISKVGQLAKRMQPLLGKNVRVQVWGSDLVDNPDSKFTIDAVQAFGAGLHIFLRSLPDGSSMHLKIAQPRGTQISNAGLEISEVKYVQWDGLKMKKVEGKTALMLIVK